MSQLSTKKQQKKKPIFQRWREEIKARGLKQSWVADQAGISGSHLSNVLAGRDIITEDVHQKITSVLGVV